MVKYPIRHDGLQKKRDIMPKRGDVPARVEQKIQANLKAFVAFCCSRRSEKSGLEVLASDQLLVVRVGQLTIFELPPLSNKDRRDALTFIFRPTCREIVLDSCLPFIVEKSFI